MKKNTTICIAISLLLYASATAQSFLAKSITRVRVINMMPNAQSNETSQDSEPNLAVNPSNTNNMVGSAFTLNQTGGTTTAPVYTSTDRGNTWALRNIVPSGNGGTGDISLKFGTQGNTLYTGTLRGGVNLTMNILRTSDPFAGGAMTLLVSRANVDQPYINAITSLVAGNQRDRLFVGNNDLGAAGGRTATVDHSADARTAAAPAGITNDVIEVRNTNGQDRPSVRCAAHSSGVVYGLFARTTASNGVNRTCDVTVVRDDNFATGASPFTALTGAGGNAGVLVATGVNMPFINAAGGLGQNRLGSHMSIAVHPGNAATVYIAWTDRTGATGTVLHVRRSTDSGATWTEILTENNGLNPALAVNSSGTAGCLYQQLVAGRWETHLRRRGNAGTTWSDMILANTPDNNPAPAFQPYLGDYCDLMAVGSNFYGVFSASNIPNNANFPQGVVYQRNANFATNQLRNLANSANVNVSIDPFFFAVEQVKLFDPCIFSPWKCRVPDLAPGLIKIKCLTEPCFFADPIPKNCLVKFNCPGCGGPNVLCPPYYHIFLDEFDPRAWNVKVVDKTGEPIDFERNKTQSGIVLSFRPSKANFIEKQIGDYYLLFEGNKNAINKEMNIKTHLEVSDYRYAEHVKYGMK
jgi:hypothetical protein